MDSIPINPIESIINLCPRKRRTFIPQNNSSRKRRNFNPENVETVILWEKLKNPPEDIKLFLEEQKPLDDLKNDDDELEIVEVKLLQKRNNHGLDFMTSVEQSAHAAAQDLLPGKPCNFKIDDGFGLEFISAGNEVQEGNLPEDGDCILDIFNASGSGFPADNGSPELKNDVEIGILSMGNVGIAVGVISCGDEVLEFGLDKDGSSSKANNTSASDIPAENEVTEAADNKVAKEVDDNEIPAENEVTEAAAHKEVTKQVADKEVTESILVNNSNEKGRIGDGNIDVICAGQEVEFLNKENILKRIKATSLGTSADHEVPESILVSDDETRLMIVAGSHYKPKKLDPFKPLGQDAHFVHSDGNGIATIGIADGVGGWSKEGIDSGVYARDLMGNAIFALQAQESGAVDPKQILHDAWANTRAKGASTACIVTLQDNLLHAVNLGDSGFMVIRDGSKVVYKSRPQQKSFNCPFQLGKASHTEHSPNDADEIKFQVENGDVLVAATDGLFDNLFPDEIARIVETCLDNNKEILPPTRVVAQTIAHFARKMSHTRDSVRPWTTTAVAAGRGFQKYKGGKYDDTTVVVGYIGDIKFMKGLVNKPSSSSRV